MNNPSPQFTSESDSPAVTIIGGGISGLTVAFNLARSLSRSKVQLAIAEASPHWGGAMITNRATTPEGNWLWEEGPNSFSPNQALLELIGNAGLDDRLLWADRKLPRFVYWDGRLQSVPSSPLALVNSQLLSGWGKLRALLGALGFVFPAHAEQESVADFFGRHLGQEVLDRLVAPFVSGVYAGDPRSLGVRSAFQKVWQLEQLGGGLLAGFLLSRFGSDRSRSKKPNAPQPRLGQLGSLVGGLNTLPQTIVQELQTWGVSTHLQWQLQEILPQAQGYDLVFQTPTGPKHLTTKALVLAVPAYTCAHLLQSILPRASESLGAIEYPPVACVALGYPQSAFRYPLRGFGHLIPRGQGIRTLGTIWASCLFPDRAPQGYELLLNFIGGATDRGIEKLPQAEIVAQVHADLQQILLTPDSPLPIPLNVKLWNRAIPQYGLEHQRRLEVIHQDIQTLPNLYLCANYLDGVAVGDCVRRGHDLAQRILEAMPIDSTCLKN